MKTPTQVYREELDYFLYRLDDRIHHLERMDESDEDDEIELEGLTLLADDIRYYLCP